MSPILRNGLLSKDESILNSCLPNNRLIFEHWITLDPQKMYPYQYGWILVWFALSVTTLGIGIQSHIETCPAQPMIPIYLIGNFYWFNNVLVINPPKSWRVLSANHTFFIVMGVFGLCSILHILVALENGPTKMVILGSLIWCFVIGGWLIYGSLVVYDRQSGQCFAYTKAYIATLLSKLTLLNNYV